MNILVLTSVYRDESRNGKDLSTNIVNLFVHEWNKQGHNVIVIHSSHMYPKLIYALPKKLIDSIIKKVGFQILDYDDVRKKAYIDDCVKVFRLPLKKYIPHKSPRKTVINHQVDKIIRVLDDNNFKPDIITGHWISPQAELISKLKTTYNCKTALVLHGLGYIDSNAFNFKNYLTNIDKLGCRSNSQAAYVKQKLDLHEEPFICYSGVPDEYLRRINSNFSKYKSIEKWKFSYVGRLVNYKNVDTIIKSLSSLQSNKWELNIIGDGPARQDLEQLCEELNCSSSVIFHGKVERDEVMKRLSESHGFIMVSNNEVFGLAYLEAMAAGCITIASKGGGVDGIIIDGFNGFLSEQGDSNELEAVICKMINMKSEQLCEIATNGYNTAYEYRDSEVAKKYLDIICNN